MLYCTMSGEGSYWCTSALPIAKYNTHTHCNVELEYFEIGKTNPAINTTLFVQYRSILKNALGARDD